MPKKPQKTKLDLVNESLENIHLKIENRGGWLSLRGIFPAKPGSGVNVPHQQRLALRISAHPDGINQARDRALEIRGLLNQGKFDWGPYLSQKKPESFGELIAELGRKYLATGGKLENWEREYVSKVFGKIENWDKPFNLEILRKIIENTPYDSRTRNRVVDGLSMLADFAGFDHDFRDLRGSYSAFHPINPRNLPSDLELSKWFHSLKNPEWRNAYGLQVIYGLRNYEIFKLDLSEFPENPIVFCHRGKTKQERFIFPLYPEWVDDWFQRAVILPDCNGSNQDLGNRVTHAYERYSIPFNPNDIRHCYARRAFECNLAVETAALSMGHRVDVHTKVYQHWITLQTYKNNYDRVMSHPDRPKPPLG